MLTFFDTSNILAFCCNFNLHFTSTPLYIIVSRYLKKMQLYIYNNDTIILTCSALHSTSILYSIASDVARNLFQGSNSWGSWASAQVGYTWVKSPDGCLG